MKALSDLEKRILNVLIEFGEIPSQPFKICEHHVTSYMNGYCEVLNKPKIKLTSSNYRYARKLAGLTLVKYNVSLGSPINDIEAGFVYIIENPKFLHHFKIGMAVDINSRLSQYQVYDPDKAFFVKHYEFCLSRRQVERNILKSFNVDVVKGEWVPKSDCIKIFREMTKFY